MRRATLSMAAAALLVLAACGGGDDEGDGAGDDTGQDGGGGGGSGDGGSYPGDGDDLDTATGCAGVYNPDQILEYHFEVPNWNTLQNDCTYETYVEADMRCGDGGSIKVGMRHKRSGGTEKPGFKVDVNHLVADQAFNSLKKMSFENGISSGPDCGGGDGDGGGASSLMTEYLGWRIHVLGGHVTGRAAFAKVHVNGDYIGTYVNVEQPDKVFLQKRLGDNDGWLYKVSGGDDGYKTNEAMANPYEDYFCFLEKNPCPAPGDLETTLPDKLDVEQLLKVGAANALIGNHDGIILKLNNYYSYDYATGPRMYFPWDLDSTLNEYDVFTGTVSGGTTVFTDVLFAHWEDDYDRILTDWLAGPLSLEAVRGEIDRAVEVAGQAMGDDPNGGGSAAAAGSDLKAWWNDRHAAVSQQVAEH